MALGLDPGQLSIKAVLAQRRGGRMQVKTLEDIPIPADHPEPADALKRWLEEQKWSQIPMGIAVNGSQVLYQNLLRDEGDPRSLEQVADMEAQRFHDMTDTLMQASATPASDEQGERRLLLSLSRPDQLRNLVEPFVESGGWVENLAPAPIALYNGVVALGEPIHSLTLFAEIGRTHTELVLADGRGIHSARSAALGVEQLNRSLAQALEVSPPEAERRRVSMQSTDELPDQAKQALDLFVSRWIRETDAFVRMAGQETPTRMMLAGGGALWEPLRQALESASPLSIHRVGRIAGLEQQESATHIVAAGMAADLLGMSRAPASLLPAELSSMHSRKRNQRYWAMTGIFSVLSMACIIALTRIAFQREQAILNRHNNTLQRCEKIRSEIESIESKMRMVEEMTMPLIRFVNNSARIRDLALHIAQNKADRDFLTFLGDGESYLRLRLEAIAEAERQAGREAPPEIRLADRMEDTRNAATLGDARMKRIIVEGFTAKKDLSTVKALIESLRTHEDVTQADLLSDDFIFINPLRDDQWTSTGYRRFVLDLKLRDAVEGGE